MSNLQKQTKWFKNKKTNKQKLEHYNKLGKKRKNKETNNGNKIIYRDTNNKDLILKAIKYKPQQATAKTEVYIC